MALLHKASITPTKAELIERWVPTQPWCPVGNEPIEVIGAFRFDDPEGQVGIETHVVRKGSTVLHVPMTYRGEPLDGAAAALIGEMEHSALGTRWIYDGLGDERYLLMVAAVTMTGQGEALGLAEHDGRWFIAPSRIRITGGGWTHERVAVDDFRSVDSEGSTNAFRNDRFELKVHRLLEPQPRPDIGLTATWAGTEPVVLAEIREL